MKLAGFCDLFMNDEFKCTNLHTLNELDYFAAKFISPRPPDLFQALEEIDSRAE
jgi:hypothetical protein